MHLLNAIIVAFITSGAAAFTLPGGLLDGVYSVHYNEEGREVHELLADVHNDTLTKRQEAPAMEEFSLGPLSARQLVRETIYCGCGFTLNPGDCDAATADLTGQLNRGSDGGCADIPGHYSYYSIRGSVVSFLCVGQADDGKTFKVCGKEFNSGLADITNACGRYIAGTAGSIDYAANQDIGAVPVAQGSLGYMRYSSGLDFCGNAETSRANKC